MAKAKTFLLGISFLEGGAVMACELVAAKLLAPYFGTSLYVWAAVLGLTLGGLTTGYYLGGEFSGKSKNPERLLYILILLASAALIIMPFTSYWIMEATFHLSLEWGALISLLIFMVPPLVFMGMVSPVVIHLLHEHVHAAGKSAGMVYAISTVGGITYTFLLGFYFIPHFGLARPVIAAGCLLAIPGVIALVSRNVRSWILIPMFLGFTFIGLYIPHKYNDEYKILYQSEGILGQVKVVDCPSYDITVDHRMGRGLIVNNTLQTYVGHEDNFARSIWGWSDYFPAAASIFPKGAKVLLLGLGGGTLVKQLTRLGFEVEVVEIDQRIWDVSLRYFHLDPSVRVTVDDARHFLKTTQNQYDMIIFDTFLGESVPEHLLTMEGIQDALERLRPRGMIMVNFYGFVTGDKGLAARSVYKTLESRGLYVDLLATPGEEAHRNIIFLASLSDDLPLENSRFQSDDPAYIIRLAEHLVDRRFVDLDDAVVLRDGLPRLAKMYNAAARSWKRSYNEYFSRHFSL